MNDAELITEARRAVPLCGNDWGWLLTRLANALERRAPVWPQQWRGAEAVDVLQTREIERLGREIERLGKCDGCGKPFDENGGICEPCHSYAIVENIKKAKARAEAAEEQVSLRHAGYLDMVKRAEAAEYRVRELENHACERLVDLNELRDAIRDLSFPPKL